MFALLRAMRPHQWVKNFFVLTPVVFAGRLFEQAAALRAAAAFGVFCAAASAIYLFNDIRDREEDRRHPLKRRRPIASGALSVSAASTAAVILVMLALAGAWVLGMPFAVVLGLYLVSNVAYTAGLKRVVILDVLLVAVGFLLRVEAGGVVVGVEVSSWLLLCTLFLALFLVVSKRRHEVVLLAGDAASQRQVLQDYSPAFLDQMIAVATGATLVSYALYAADPATVARFGSRGLLATIPLVVYGIFRYLWLVYHREDERAPTEALLTDRPFLVNLVLWAALVVAIVYWT
jgi:4-hydroxybenzoate polyprenyltransferase